MANTASAKKAIRVSARRNKINRRAKDNFKSARKSVIAAIEAGDEKAVTSKLSAAYSSIDFACITEVIPVIHSVINNIFLIGTPK